ncbi:MAG: folate family ECF transporter S component [Bacillota bacterium]
MRNGYTRHLVLAGLLIALNIIFVRLLAFKVMVGGTTTLRLSFGTIPVMFAGLLLGPWWGAAVGAMGDLVGFALNPGGAFFPGFTLTAALTGFIPGVLLHRNYQRGMVTVVQLLAVVALSELVTVLLNTYWLTFIIGKGFMVLLPMRAAARAVTIPVYTLVLQALRRIVPAGQAVGQ